MNLGGVEGSIAGTYSMTTTLSALTIWIPSQDLKALAFLIGVLIVTGGKFMTIPKG
jgi:hypothetical protein